MILPVWRTNCWFMAKCYYLAYALSTEERAREEKDAVSYAQDNIETFLKNELKSRGDTFRFDCKMCGKCCRKRREPILINGADAFRMARALGESVQRVVVENTIHYLGENSHVPVIVLKERMDGSCRMLRNGKCMVQQDKPAVCALYPLGRYQDLRDGSVHYFLNPGTCAGYDADREWTLQEWLDRFKLEENGQMTLAWNGLFSGICSVTCKMAEEDISEEMRAAMAFALYIHYDTERSFVEQVEENKTLIQAVFRDRFHITLDFA